jgi:oligopeptide transport system substrate-binding protein
MGWTADFADPITFLSLGMTGNGNNYSGWSDATFDSLMNRAGATADTAARLELFQQAETRLLAEAPVSPVVNRSRTYLIHPAVKNWDSAIVGIHLYKKVYLAP